MAQYWVVGATFEQGKDDNLKRSFAAAIGALGARKRVIAPLLRLRHSWVSAGECSQATVPPSRNGWEMAPNTMKIRALGIITKVDQDEEHRVDVDWLLTHLDRDDVPLHGCAPQLTAPTHSMMTMAGSCAFFTFDTFGYTNKKGHAVSMPRGSSLWHCKFDLRFWFLLRCPPCFLCRADPGGTEAAYSCGITRYCSILPSGIL